MPSSAARKRAKAAERLDVYANSVMVGSLQRLSSGALSFEYHSSWLEREAALPISRQLPLREAPYAGQPVFDYFDGLLPDDRRVREKIAARARAKGTRSFDLLAAVGRDCVGALQFYPEGLAPGPLSSVSGRELSDAEIAKILRNLRVNPLGIQDTQDFRISLAGVQSKTALLSKDGRWLLPEGATPTTHILKPAIGKSPDSPDFTLSVENEWLCLKLLRACGLQAAEADIVDFDGVRALSVQRFDRLWSGKKLFRLPQEDFCQALGYGPARKYESDGGPGIVDCMELLNESDERDGDRAEFFKAQILFWLLGAIDGHAKNFSCFLRPGGFVMTPLYDVMSAEPHLHPSHLPPQKIKLAMAVGDGRHFRIKEVLPRHWRQTAKRCKFPYVERLLEELAIEVPKALEQVNRELPKGFPARVGDSILKGIRSRLKLLS